MLGSGGREHALAWALARSPDVKEVVVAPGNPGCEQPAAVRSAPIRRAPLPSMTAADVVIAAQAQHPDLVVVGPEMPLCAGVVDALASIDVLAFGPTRSAARLEGSKAFMKRLATDNGIPTAPFLITSEMGPAEAYIRARTCRVVIKTDGLAAGKGAVVSRDHDHAVATARDMLLQNRFGAAGHTIIIEDLLPGVEMSVHAITDGQKLLVLPIARDHKRIGDGDRGPNTGGMGAFAPVTITPRLLDRVEREVLLPTLAGMRKLGCPYRGVLYAGIMVAPDGTPYLLEHNVRFGDPETQALVPLLQGDLAALLHSAARGALDKHALQVNHNCAAVTVVMASAGYPQSARRGDIINGIERAEQHPGVHIFHAGTTRSARGLATNGGRVLAITATANTVAEARTTAYNSIAHIHFDGMQYRRDIAVTATACS
ncbi:MAG TPA: phosphoribosylamine--glycine ligase [Sorangium sp.]|nr:phosphoribosylamine--glycine ligase [Sorangium sp.]